MSERVETFSEAHALLSRLVPNAREFQEAVLSLERIRALMEALGNPQNTFKTIHVAGTSGKTSTCYYLAALLKAAGQKVGLTISPHIDEVNERLQINLKPLSEKRFCRALTTFMGLVEKSQIKPTYFEFLVALAYWEFARQKVDYAVIEVGLGGLLDATNVVTRTDKICVMTDMGLDHTHLLGQTLAEITAQKAGIIRPNNVVFSYEQGDEVMDVLREVCEQQQAELHEIWRLSAKELPKQLPIFQRHNWYLALSVQRYLTERDQLPDLDEAQLAATTETYIPARMETVTFRGKTLIMDGAHNAQKLKALVSSIRNQYPKKSVAALVSFKSTKQVRLKYGLAELLPLLNHLIVTTFLSEQDTTLVSVEPSKVVERCEELGFEGWEIIADPQKAFRQLLKRKEDVLLITGSFYLMNHIRPLVFHTAPSAHRRSR